jgi:hypothetical protein
MPRPGRTWVRLLARLHATSLDRQLAAGRSPESTRLLAVRAQQLVAPSARRALARNVEVLFERAQSPSATGRRPVPLCRDRITAAEGEWREMLASLVAPVPMAAQGVAMISRLLSDGAGPLYHPRCPTDLSAALWEATARLEPLRSGD